MISRFLGRESSRAVLGVIGALLVSGCPGWFSRGPSGGDPEAGAAPAGDSSPRREAAADEAGPRLALGPPAVPGGLRLPQVQAPPPAEVATTIAVTRRHVSLGGLEVARVAPGQGVVRDDIPQLTRALQRTKTGLGELLPGRSVEERSRWVRVALAFDHRLGLELFDDFIGKAIALGFRDVQVLTAEPGGPIGEARGAVELRAQGWDFPGRPELPEASARCLTVGLYRASRVSGFCAGTYWLPPPGRSEAIGCDGFLVPGDEPCPAGLPLKAELWTIRRYSDAFDLELPGGRALNGIEGRAELLEALSSRLDGRRALPVVAFHAHQSRPLEEALAVLAALNAEPRLGAVLYSRISTLVGQPLPQERALAGEAGPPAPPEPPPEPRPEAGPVDGSP